MPPSPFDSPAVQVEEGITEASVKVRPEDDRCLKYAESATVSCKEGGVYRYGINKKCVEMLAEERLKENFENAATTVIFAKSVSLQNRPPLERRSEHGPGPTLPQHHVRVQGAGTVRLRDKLTIHRVPHRHPRAGLRRKGKDGIGQNR